MCVQDSTRRSTGQKKNTVDQRSITHQAENRTVTIRYERGPIMANVVGLPLVVLGYDGCGYYTRAVEAATEAGIEFWPTKFDSREQFQDYISAQNISTKIKHHRSSPVVFELAAQSMPATRTPRNVLDADVLASATFVGGCDDLLRRLGLSLDDGAPSRSPSQVFKYFESVQKSNHFVLWILWRTSGTPAYAWWHPGRARRWTLSPPLVYFILGFSDYTVKLTFRF